MSAPVCVCVRARVRACVRACVYMCVCLAQADGLSAGEWAALGGGCAVSVLLNDGPLLRDALARLLDSDACAFVPGGGGGGGGGGGQAALER